MNGMHRNKGGSFAAQSGFTNAYRFKSLLNGLCNLFFAEIALGANQDQRVFTLLVRMCQLLLGEVVAMCDELSPLKGPIYQRFVAETTIFRSRSTLISFRSE
jgi:hypothetical protein